MVSLYYIYVHRITDFKISYKILGLVFSSLILVVSTASLFASNYYLLADQVPQFENLVLSSDLSLDLKTENPKVFSVQSNIDAKDRRGYVLDQYFKKYNSPLYGYGSVFVSACDKYKAPQDCITVAAIAKHETNLCNYKYSAEMFNCWGFGGADGHRRQFSSFEDGIYTVTQVLVNEYGIKYMINPSLMEKTFCGTIDPLCEGWGGRVKAIMNDINEFSKSINMGDLYSLR